MVTALTLPFAVSAQDTSTPSATTATPQGGTLRGTVAAATTGKAPAIPLPGVAITATNSITGKKYVTATALDGTFSMAIPRNGRYILRADFAAFASQTQEVVLKDAAAPAPANFSLELASRAAAATEKEAQQAAATPAASLARGLNSLRLSGNAGDALDASANPATDANNTLPTLSGLSDSTDSVAISGQAGQTNALGGISEDDLRSRVEDAVAQARASGQLPPGAGGDTNAIVNVIGGILGGGGGFGGGGAGGGRGGRGGGAAGGGFGNFRNFNPAQPHGSLFYQGGNSALDSAPWSPTLLPQINPSAYSNRFGVTLAGSPYIPGLTRPNTRQFVFLNLTGQKNLNAFLPNPVRVPTDLERTGDFSKSFQVVSGALTPVTLYDPATSQPLTYNGRPNVLDPARRTAQALALLQYYPEPNIVTADPTAYNYQTISNAGSNNISLNARYVRQLGAATSNPFGGGSGRGTGGGQRRDTNAKPTLHQNINIGYNVSHSAADQRNIFLLLGGANENDGNGLTAGYTIGFGRLSNNATLSWNRNSAQTRNYFTDTANNPSAATGIAVPNQAGTLPDPLFYNGLPSLSITNFAPLSNTTPSKLINQTISFSDFISYRHKKHNYRFGFDIRRVHADQVGGDNPLGRFTFTGFATAAPASATQNANTASGSGFADFLLGLPQSTQLQAGLYKIYLRENTYDAYAQDDFRILANLTLNLGLRYEYFGPYTEKNNRLVNLDHNAGYTAFAAVLPNATGPYSGQYNRSVVNPDNTMLSPRLGVAYRPKFLPRLSRDTVLRGGYGINFNTGQYAQFARSLSHQAPFADTETNTLTSGCTTRTPSNAAPSLTLAHGFGCSTLYRLQNNFAVDRNYRLGVVQVYNLNLQRTIPLNIVLNLGYNGSYGNHLDFLGTPNANSLGSTVAGVAPFDLDTSIATSRSNQLVVSAQKRQTHGIALGATYTFQHAITNASGVGGVSGTPAQNFFNPAAEFGNASFDRRHQLTGNWVAELPFGPNRAFLNKGGLPSHLLDGFSLSGTFTFASGQYFTPQYSGSIAEAGAGTTYTQRPDRNYTTASTGPGTYKTFFNTAAFVAPGTQNTAAGQLTLPGTAAPNSIEGPGTVQVTAALSRTISLGDTRSFEARVTASNIFNTVQYSGINTTQNSANFGQVTSAAAMRALQVQARYRF